MKKELKEKEESKRSKKGQETEIEKETQEQGHRQEEDTKWEALQREGARVNKGNTQQGSKGPRRGSSGESKERGRNKEDKKEEQG